MKRALPIGLVLGSSLLSCGPSIEPQSRLTSFRVLGVQKDKPYARPGETVTLRMLLADELGDTQRPVDVVWLTSCTNPPGDLYAACAPQLAALDVSRDLGRGLEHSYVLPEDIIEPVRKPPYGLSVVFFAACAGGTIVPDTSPELLLPIACKSPSGARLGADSFIIGYTQVYAYAEHANINPIVTGFSVKVPKKAFSFLGDDRPPFTGLHKTVPHECIGQDCVDLLRREVGGDGMIPLGDAGAGPDGGQRDAATVDGAVDGGGAGGTDGGLPEGGVSAGSDLCNPIKPGCIEACSKDTREDCPRIELKLLVDQVSAERNTVIEELEGGRILEQMWVNYYVDRGLLLNEVKLLNDSTLGWNEAHEAEFIAPKTAGPVTVWAVAHDNRGGVQWTRVRLQAMCAPRDGRCQQLTGASSPP